MKDISRIGVVSAVDRKNGMVSVVYEDRDGKVTQPFPFLNFNDEYKMPKPGDHVAVMHLSNGTEMGVVLGKYWNEADTPVDPDDVYRKQFDYEGKAFLKYDEKKGELLLKAPKIRIISQEKSIDVESDVNVTGDAVISGISYTGHTHMGAHGETAPPQ